MSEARDRLLVVLSPGDAVGFRLAGATVMALDPASPEAPAALRKLLTARETAFVALEESLLPKVPLELSERIRREGMPVIVPFTMPRRAAPSGAADRWVEAMLREAIGYHVKIGAGA